MKPKPSWAGGCLSVRELVMDREAWCAAIHGVAKSWTRLSCQAKRAPRAAFPSGCLAAQTKRWAEGIRVPAPLAGGPVPLITTRWVSVCVCSHTLFLLKQSFVMLSTMLKSGKINCRGFLFFKQLYSPSLS